MDLSPPRKSFLFHKICFFILGFCGAIPWFTILSTLDFYVANYPSYNVALSIIIPNLMGQGLFCILIYFLSFALTLNVRIKYALIALILLLIILLIIPISSSEQGLYWLVLIMIFFLGSFNTVFQTSSTALCYVFPVEYPPLFFLGNSMAGVFTVGLRMILMKSMETLENPLMYSTIGFILAAVMVLTIAILLYENLTTTPLYFTCLYQEWKQSLAQSIVGSQLNGFNSFKQVEIDENAKMDKYKNLLNSIFSDGLIENDDKEEKDISFIKDQKQTFTMENYDRPSISFFEISRKNYNGTTNSVEIQNVQFQDSFNLKGSTDTIRRNKNKLDWGFFYPILKKISPMMILIMLLLAQSLFVFPGMVIKKHLFPDYLNSSWNSLLWILLFNLSDTSSKILTLWPLRLRIQTFRILVFLRFLFWGSFILIKNSSEGDFVNNEWFCMVHLIIFSVFGGVLTNGLMIAALESGRSHEKETIGLLISVPAVYGMMLGSLLALFSKYI